MWKYKKSGLKKNLSPFYQPIQAFISQILRITTPKEKEFP